tara:strand:+ start:651 stop:854 length:204 start_codon:yes stop_codon:yes gene_type:complete
MSKKDERLTEIWIDVECVNLEIDMALDGYSDLQINRDSKSLRSHLREISDKAREVKMYKELTKLLIN